MRDSAIACRPRFLRGIFRTASRFFEVPFRLISVKIIEHNSAGKLCQRRHPLRVTAPSAITEASSPNL